MSYEFKGEGYLYHSNAGSTRTTNKDESIMTTQEFISKTYNVAGKTRHCSSVMTDADGTVYSYGYHYPLVMRIAGLDIINTRGYSMTTERHILWAKAALDYDYIGAQLTREDTDAMRYADTDTKLRIVLTALRREEAELKQAMDAKKRKDTQVYKHLAMNWERVNADANKVEEAL